MSRKANLRERSVFPSQVFDTPKPTASVSTTRAIVKQGSGGTTESEPLPVARVVITSNISLSGTITSGTSDGVTLASGDWILLVAQSTGAQNGLYIYNPTLPAYQRTAHTLRDGLTITIGQGALFAGTSWRCITNDPITRGTTATVWRQTDSTLLHAVGNTLHRNQFPTTASGYGLFNVTSTTGDGVPVIIVNEDSGAAVDITGTGSVGPGVKVSGSGVSYAFESNNNPVAFYAVRNASGATGAMVQVYQQHSSNTSDVVEMHTDGGGRLMNLYNSSGSGAGAAAFITIAQQSASFAQNTVGVSSAATGAYHGVSSTLTAATNTGAAVAGATAGGSGGAGVKGSSTSTAYAMYALKTGSSGECLVAIQQSGSNTSPTIYAEHQGLGNSGYFYRATHGGSKAVVRVESNDSADDQATVYVVNAGVGYGLEVNNSNTGTTDSAIRARNSGTGAAVEAVSSATNALAIDAQGITQTFSLKGAGNAPTGAAGPGAGTAPTINVSGTDLGGRIDVTTGTGPAGSATVVTINFDVTQGNAPGAIIISPANAAAAALTGGAQVFANQPGGTVGAWTLDVGATGLAATTAYQWSFMVIL